MVNLGFDVLTVVNMKSAIFWDVVPCNLLDIYRETLCYQTSTGIHGGTSQKIVLF